MKLLHVRYGLYGLALGFLLSRMGFSDYGELHALFVFADLRLLAAFASAVVVAMASFAWMDRRLLRTRSPVTLGHVAGGALFGAGWALTGACPSLALVQLGEGKLAALATLAGIALGAYLYPRARGLWPWRATSCDA